MATSTAAGADGYGSKAYRSYALGVLLLVYIFNAIDRMLLSILQERIKVDLGLSDFQLGLIGGPAFVVLYTLTQIPIARLAERANRISIIAVGAAAWSFATAACGLANNFVQLALARIAVGIGEAACVPPSHSVLSDCFPAKHRATAFAVFGLGIPIGTTTAAVVGGLIGQHADWRVAFFVLGLPGVAAAILLKLTVKEPPRSGAHGEAPNFGATLRYLLRKTAFRHLMAGYTLMAIFAFSMLQFLVSFLLRKFGLELAQASAMFGLIAGLGIAIGIFFGGFVADKMSPRDPRALAWTPAVALLAAVPFMVLGYLQTTPMLAVTFLLIGAIFSYANVAPSTAMGQMLAEPRMRATASALLLTVNGLVGYGLGPPIVGAIGDIRAAQSLAPVDLTPAACKATPALEACARASAEGLQAGLLVAVAFLAWASVHYWLAGRSLVADSAQ